jgi:hypothetical protein
MLTLCGAAFAVLALAAPAAGTTRATASSVIVEAQAAIAHQSRVHVVFIAHSGSPARTEKIVADVGAASGTETVAEGASHLTIEITAGSAYVSGDEAGLTTLFGMSAADAKKVGSKWETWKSGSGQYASLKSDLTMSSVSALLPKAKGTKLSKTGAGSPVLKWIVNATSSTPALSDALTLSAGPTTLPVTESTTAKGGTKVTTTLSAWGEQILVRVPPATSVIASSNVTG